MDNFELLVGALKHSGWTELSVTRSIEQFVHSYRATLTDQWADDHKPVPLNAGDPAEVYINGRRRVSGYIDEDSISYSARSQSLEISGRSKTGDLVDCAAIHKGGQWRDTGLLRIAKDLCRPFGITVSTRVSLGKRFTNPNFKLQEGETAFDCIARGARMRGVLMLTDSDGNLVFDRRGTTKVTTVLERGRNILSGSVKRSWADRFSRYTVKTQASGTDESYGKAATLQRSATDRGINRHRPTIIMADNEDSGTELQRRVVWERNVRAGRGLTASYTVPGWEHSEGLWNENTLVRVIDASARLDDELLITSVTQTRGAGGTKTRIELTFPEAFDVQPLPPPKKKAESLY